MLLRVTAFSLVWSLALAPPTASASEALAERIASAFSADARVSQRSGLRVVTVPDGEVIYSSPRAEEPFIPASNQKLLVSAAGLVHLGPDYVWKTHLAVCESDLVVMGSGDPAIGDPVLATASGASVTGLFEVWADVLKRRGHTEIAGDLVVDASAFDEQWFHPNWSDADTHHWYGAPVGGLNFNDNCIDVTVIPGDRAGRRTTIRVVPESTSITIDNRSRSGGDGVPVIARQGRTHEFVITGSCSRRAELTSAPVVDPPLFFAGVLQASLAAQGIRIQGETRRATLRRADDALPDTCTLLATHETRLRDVLPRMNKRSQNFFAECVHKTLGRHAEPGRVQTGTWPLGADVVRRVLAGLVADPTGLVVDDGSGLSRHNRVSPRQLTDVLTAMFHGPHRDVFVGSLAVAGVDGTLEKRRGMQAIKGQVMAKTGYISGVRTLSGYVRADSGRWFAFAFLYNDRRPRIGTLPATRLQDRICRILAGE